MITVQELGNEIVAARLLMITLAEKITGAKPNLTSIEYYLIHSLMSQLQADVINIPVYDASFFDPLVIVSH